MTGLGEPARDTSAERSSSELLGRRESSGFASRWLFDVSKMEMVERLKQSLLSAFT